MADPVKRNGGSSPPLGDLLSLLRPTRAETTLLRACLLKNEKGREALESWSRSGPEVDLLPPRLNRLFPLLAEGTRRADVGIDPRVRSRLRAALASEEVRYEAYTRVLGPALAALTEEGITAIVLKGAALAETVYPKPPLRHSHDVDLLLADDQRAGAVACLQQRGWSRSGIEPDPETDTLVHRFGLPLCLHTRLIRGSLPATDFEALRQRAQPITLAEVPVLTLSRADALFHILGQAVSSGGFSSLQWACDAYLCSKREGRFDWEHFVEELKKTPLAVAYVELLLYLRDELDVAVPDAIIAVDDRRAAPVSWSQREAVVASFDAGAFGRRRMWAQARSWSTRFALLKWLLFPSAKVARAIAPGIPPWQLPFRNLQRATS